VKLFEKRFVLIIIFFLLSTQIVFSKDDLIDASVYIRNVDYETPSLVIDGDITNNTVEDILRLTPRLLKLTDFFFVSLDSNGGDVNAAMQIGNIMRSLNATTFVPQKATCQSSCVFVLAGGVKRSVRGKVGIHRPYDPYDRTTSPEQQKIKYKELEKKVKSYLEEVNIPESLYEEMMRVSPRGMKYLTREELEKTGLGLNDPYYEEASVAAELKRYNISRAEYIRRQEYIQNVCYEKYSLFSDEQNNCIINMLEHGHE